MRAHVFVDAGWLLQRCKFDKNQHWPDPGWFGGVGLDLVNGWGGREWHAITRTTLYDAYSETSAKRQAYWAKVEEQRDCEVKHGFVKEKTRRQTLKQVAVDIHLGVDLVVGAYTGIYDIAILVAGDDDFFPAVYEARRRGVCVALVSSDASCGDELKHACDRFVLLNETRFRSASPLLPADEPVIS